MRNSVHSDFERRLARIDRIHAAGGAFEATGALGRAYFDSHRPKGRRRFPWRAVAMVLLGMLLFKAAILAQIGPETYAHRVETLAAGTTVERVGSWVLRADAPTQFIAAQLHAILY
ncbi:hypothetical protein C8J30_109103 [Rhodobacter viridis]|uniref:Uncharacterized protein n=1 Tax=Rhodobacter viridis TaxID=1054202 RepID=A0A318U063_9RHOB|nr:hypothetical protein [Rhodobacter viridis]PYF09357.1 hypothetical protein C8J30_109103 [Rhodobacter viridis]